MIKARQEARVLKAIQESDQHGREQESRSFMLVPHYKQAVRTKEPSLVATALYLH